MASSAPLTPSSGKSLYFDALPNASDEKTQATNLNVMTSVDADKPIVDGAADVERAPSVANPAIIGGRKSVPNGKAAAGGHTLDATTEHEEVKDEDEEGSAPSYTEASPDEKLSRTYGTDTKPPLPPRPESPKEKDTSTSIAPPASPAHSHPDRATSIISTDHAKSPTSIRSGTSGHKRDEGSAFANGAAITGPNGTPDIDPSLHQRHVTAESTLSDKTKNRLSKAELKDAKRLSKVIKSEAKAEKKALSTAIKELAELQKQQAAAVKREAKAHSAHSKALELHHKTESKYLQLKAVYERNQLNSQNMEAALETERANARDVSERTAEKAKEVEKLRVTFATDEREREAKILELNQGQPPKKFLGIF